MPTNRHRRRTVKIVNPAPEGAAFTTESRAQRFVDEGKAEWIPGTLVIRFFRRGESEAIRQEMAARMRREGEAFVEQAVAATRYGAISWSGAKRPGMPAWERAKLPPILPGRVCS